MKKLYRPVVWSNIFYAIPLGVALSYGLSWTAGSVAALLVCSFGFHWYREKRFIVADILAAGMVVALCTALLFTGGANSGYLLIAGLLILAGLYIRYKLENGDRGSLAHALWHLIAATVILSCIFSYVG